MQKLALLDGACALWTNKPCAAWLIRYFFTSIVVVTKLYSMQIHMLWNSNQIFKICRSQHDKILKKLLEIACEVDHDQINCFSIQCISCQQKVT